MGTNKNVLQMLLAFLVIAVLNVPANGAIIGLNIHPFAQNVSVGEVFSVDVEVSGLESSNLHNFDLSLIYDKDYIDYDSSIFETGFVTNQSVTPTAGNLGFSSTYSAPLASQPDFFSLVTVYFTAVQEFPVKTVTIANPTLYDSGFSPLTVNYLNEGYVEITASAAPIPAAAWLLGSGLFGFSFIRRRNTK